MIKTKKGFTLIELLIAISIIGVMSTFALFGLNNAQRTARDAKRKADLENIRAALELHYSDCGIYPAPSSNRPPSPLDGDCAPGHVYMSETPVDPKAGNNYYYSRSAGNTRFLLCAALENDPGTPTGSCGSCGSNSCNYSIGGP